VNTHEHPLVQAWTAFYPNVVNLARRKSLAEAFEHGYRDAAMYERWEEDPYHYAKPDRSPSDDYNWTMIRRAFAGGTDNETSL